MADHPNLPVEQIGQLLDMVAEKLPRIIVPLKDTLFSATAGREMGEAVGNFYQQLVEKGIPAEKALELAEDYLKTLTSITNMMSSHRGGH